MNLHTIITAIILCITILYLYKYIKKHEIKKTSKYSTKFR